MAVHDLFTSDNSTMMVSILVGLLCIMAIWSSLTRMHPDQLLPSTGHKAKGIFLTIHFRATKDASKSDAVETGHLMTLGVHSAELVSNRDFKRGDRLDLDLSTLPAFPLEGASDSVKDVVAEVHSTRKLEGEPAAYLITMHFPELGPQVREPLLSYIGQLATSGRLSPA